MSFFQKAPKNSIKTETPVDADTGKKEEGELAIDLYETEKYLVIQSPIAGVKTEVLDINVENNILTIRGKRLRPKVEEIKNYLYQECYWGPFSRRIALPVEIDSSRIEATLKEGILTLKLLKIIKEKSKKVTVQEEPQ